MAAMTMTRSFSQPNRILSFALHGRGYTVASDVCTVRGGLATNRIEIGKVEEKNVTKDGCGPPLAWGPDPVTGYYRPINHTTEIDPVELRHMLLNHKIRS